MTHPPLTFVDIETTGTSPVVDRIIEIAAVRVEDGKISQVFSTLLDPQTYLSPFITSLTGITSRELESAPTFYQIQDKLADILTGSIIVAHNVRFDYGFIRQEFKRHGSKFTTRKACTIALFKSLVAGLPHYDLDSLISYFSLECSQRHRALGDAMVLWDFFRAVPSPISSAWLSSQTSKSSFPPHFTPSLVESLPDAPGVYILEDSQGMPLYVGHSVNIHDRVLSHFRGAASSASEYRLSQQVASITSHPTGGKLLAQMLESHLIKSLKPLHNRLLREVSTYHLVLQKRRPDGYFTAETVTSALQDLPGLLPEILGIYTSSRQAKQALTDICVSHQLCPKLLGLESSGGACFNFHLGRCPGFCLGREDPLRYNLRFLTAFNKPFRSWPFPHPILISESLPDLSQYIAVDNWQIIASNIPLLSPVSFDLDHYKILSAFLTRPYPSASITPYAQPEN